MLPIIVQVVLTAVILGFLYIRMIRREVPKPIGTWQALVPVLLGVVSILVSTLLTVAISMGLGLLGARVDEIGNPVVQSAVKAFVGAGLTEELIKLLMMLLSFRLFRPKNVYEYILIGAAVGIGFTLHEEYAYAGSAVGFLRMITLGTHTALGIVMARYLGMARYQRRTGRSGAAKRIVPAFALPVLIHTAYDACTVANPALQGLGTGMDETSMLFYLVAGIAAILACAVWQVVVLVKLKKRAAEYSAMKTAADDSAPPSPEPQ